MENWEKRKKKDDYRRERGEETKRRQEGEAALSEVVS